MQLSVRSFAARVTTQVESGQLDAALRAIHDFVDRIVSEPLCTAVVFGSATLDELCRKIGSRSWASLQKPTPATTLIEKPPTEKPTIVYIVTKLQKSGGHTRVLDDLIGAAPDAAHVIISTELAGRSDRVAIGDGAADGLSVALEYAPRESFAGRLAWLQGRLVALAPLKVYLFNHHQDAVAVAAVVPELGLDVWYYHHADHHLALGVLSPHFKHIDPHPMGYDNCRHRLGIDNVYLPLTFDDQGMRPADLPFLEGGKLTTCTAARSNKLELPYMINYADVIVELLRVTKGTHIHIGRLTPWYLFRLRRKLRRAGVERERFVYIPWVKSVWKTLIERRVDLYVSSFPYGGGLTLLEAMGSGTPITMHKHMMSRILSGIDLAHREALLWRNPEELFDYCRSVTPAMLESQSRVGREHYEKYHHRQKLSDALANIEQLQPLGRADAGFRIQADEWACWMEQRVSLGSVAYRALYRLYKRLRARFS